MPRLPKQRIRDIGWWMLATAASIVTMTLFAGGETRASVTERPAIWNDAALGDWATPVAGLNARPGHFTAGEYYSVPADNLRTYPVYRPDAEPAGYWDWLRQQKPAPLVDARALSGVADWVAAGERAFRELDAPLTRSSDPALLAYVRDPKTYEKNAKLRDGTVFGIRWVVTEKGVMLSALECGNCHNRITADRTVEYATAKGDPPPLGGPVGLRDLAPRLILPGLMRQYTEPLSMIAWRMFRLPWAPDERIERMPGMSLPEVGALMGPRSGTIPRPNGSPFAATKIPDLRSLRYSRYLDATGTHRLRGPEDVGRYAAFITGADPMDFGPHRLLTESQRRVPARYADEVLYAIGTYLLSLQPPLNPHPAPKEQIDRGERVFTREGCASCHVPPAYTSGRLTLARGFDLPPQHPNRADVLPFSVETDPGLALGTRKGTGFYKIPSLRGVWDRPRLLHDGSLASLEELFDLARLGADYEPRGWNPPGVTTRAVPGHTFGTRLHADDKAALLAFLRSL